MAEQSETKELIVPALFQPLYCDRESDIFLITGGRYSAKTHNLKQYLAIALMQPEYFRAICTRYNFGAIRDSIRPAIIDTIDEFNWRGFFEIQPDRIIHRQSGNCIVFKGLKKSELTQQKGKAYQGFNVFIVEEAQEWTRGDEFFEWFRSFRVEGQHNRAILVLNPTHREHWIHQKFYTDLRITDGFNGIDQSGMYVRYIHSSYRVCEKHLPPNILRELEALKESDPKAFQNIVEGGWLDDDDRALFRWEWIQRNRLDKKAAYGLREYIIVVDPAADGSEDHHDKHGILVMGADSDGTIYVCNDKTMHGSVADCANLAISLYKRYNASCIVVEKNNGGKWIATVFEQIDKYVSVKEVSASQGKIARMEPAAAYCQRDKIKFCGVYAELEGQLCSYTGAAGQRSPNNYDCLAWGYHYFSGRYGAVIEESSATGLF